MSEPLTMAVMLDVVQDLVVAFPKTGRDPQGTARIYRENLDGYSGEAVRAAGRAAIRELEFFPKVHQLRELARQYVQRTNAALLPVRRAGAERECAVCGARPEHRQVLRKVIRIEKSPTGREQYLEVLDARGQPTWETITSPRDEMVHDRALHGIHDREVPG